MRECPYCSGEGMIGGCSGCGTFNFNTQATIEESSQADYRVPTYYVKNQWSDQKIKRTENQHTLAILNLLDKLVKQTAEGRKINASYAVFLPHSHGKKTAMFTIIQNYIQHGFTVAPVIDVATLAIIENNFQVKDKKSAATWMELRDADLVCVYGVDFSARYLTAKLYTNLCSIRAIQGRPTLLFAENSLEDLKSKYISESLSENNNVEDNGCKLANPLVLDGVTKRGVRKV